MKWHEMGYLGVGESGVPFFDMTPWVDVESMQAQEVKAEVDNLLGKFKISFHPKNNAYVPEDIIGKKWLTYYIWRAQEFIAEEVRNSFVKDIDVAKWIYDQKLVPLNWSYMANFMKPTSDAWTTAGHLNFNKMKSPGIWIEEAPLLKKWIESWNVFDVLTRIVIFVNAPGEDVAIHRDFATNGPQSIHNLSIQFTKDRPGFIYDEINKEKIYYRTPAYSFNVGDNHGVDAQNENLYTIRIDGIFKEDVCKKLGIRNGMVWSPEYKSAKKLKNIQIFEPDERP